MKIYYIRCDVNNFQTLYLADEDPAIDSPYDLANLPSRTHDWQPPEVYFDPPLGKRGDFIDLWACDAFAMVPDAYAKLKDILAPAGEILPLPHEGVEYKLLHFTRSHKCLDPRTNPADCHPKLFGAYPRIYFQAPLVPQVSIFKCDASSLQYFAVERTGDPKTEFKAAVEHHGLSGLLFQEIWEG